MNQVVGWLALLPAAAVFLSAFERRRHWRHPDYQLVNRALACLGVGLVLMSPKVNWIGKPIGLATDHWHFEDLVGHTLILAALTWLSAHALRSIRKLTPELVFLVQVAGSLFLSALWLIWYLTDMSTDPSRTVDRTGGIVYWSVLATGFGVVALYTMAQFWLVAQKAPKPWQKTVSRLYVIAAGFLLAASIHRLYELTQNQFEWRNLAVDYTLRTCAVIAIVCASHLTFWQFKKPLVVPSSVPVLPESA